MKVNNNFPGHLGTRLGIYGLKMKIAKDRKVIPDPIDDRKFQEWKESGKSGILLGITLNPRKCIGEKVRRIPINVETKW